MPSMFYYPENRVPARIVYSPESYIGMLQVDENRLLVPFVSSICS